MNMLQAPSRRVHSVFAASRQASLLHTGRATPQATSEFLQNASNNELGSSKLRINDTEHAMIGRTGVGSPYIWSHDIPRIDASKKAVSTRLSNFIQATINPFQPPSSSPDNKKQAYVESLVLQELINDDGIPREALVISALLSDNLLYPSPDDSQLSPSTISDAIAIATSDLEVECLDHAVVRIPTSIFSTGGKKLQDALSTASDTLSELCQREELGSFGFALPSFSSIPLSTMEDAVATSFQNLSSQYPRFSSIQLPVNALSPSFMPLPSSLTEFCSSSDVLLIAEKIHEASLSNGKPFVLRNYHDRSAEDVATLLHNALNLAISVERKYIETVLPTNAHANLPPADDMAWGQILASQHERFDNLEEWLFLKETQIQPRMEATIKELSQHEETQEIGFAYSVAGRELLKCFSASIELLEAERANKITQSWQQAQLMTETDSIESVALQAAYDSGANLVLTQDPESTSNAKSLATRYSTELSQLPQTASQHLDD